MSPVWRSVCVVEVPISMIRVWKSERSQNNLALYKPAILSIPGVVLYLVHSANKTLQRSLTWGSERSDVPETRSRSSSGSSTNALWKREPAFWMSPSRIVSARSWRCTLPYLSFFLRARAASAGPVACSLMTSTRSGIPLSSSSSNCSLVRRSIATVTEEYGFFWDRYQHWIYYSISRWRNWIWMTIFREGQLIVACRRSGEILLNWTLLWLWSHLRLSHCCKWIRTSTARAIRLPIQMRSAAHSYTGPCDDSRHVQMRQSWLFWELDAER